MSLSDHFFKGKLCECSFRYIIAWCFFLGAIGISTTIILINPKHIDYSNIPETVQIIFVVTLSSIAGIISRCLCYESKVYTELPNNKIQYADLPYNIEYDESDI